MATAIGRYTPTRRDFIASATAAAGATALGRSPARAAAKYTRYNVTSAQGQKALASYAKGVEAMLKLPADDPRNWLRNAFIHLMDCPHGNWWFYVWHRGYLGYFEQTIRSLSGDDTFAIPYWDWTQLPRIPEAMFDGVLDPTGSAFEPYTGNLQRFTNFVKPALTKYWNALSSSQRAQVKIRGYATFDDLWSGPAGVTGAGVAGNEAYANTCGARYLSRGNPKFDKETAYDVSAFIVTAGLLPTDFYNADNLLSFTSSKTTSHEIQPDSSTKFSVLEGFPHNNVHNYTGGVGPLDPGPYGNMTNFLSPVDPIFFLHHSNMDRLWDVWTRKQQRLHLPYLPDKADFKTFAAEPFQFYVNAAGHYVGPRKAGDYLSTAVFGYDYEPGFGENVIGPPRAGLAATRPAAAILGTVRGNVGTVAVPRDTIRRGLTATESRPLMLAVTITRPAGTASARTFDVLVNAPAGTTQAGPDSPNYAGTIAFFGPMMTGMNMSGDATFAVPLRRTLRALGAAASAAASTTLTVRVVPSHGRAGTPQLKGLSVRAL
jgi:tyrosinase